MKLAIMQPYLFPYIGYFQLIRAVEEFVVYDDVNFIKQGWINRNRTLNNGAPLLFTVPLENASSFSRINEVRVDLKQYNAWKNKFLKTLALNYKKAPQFDTTIGLIGGVLDNFREGSVADLALSGIRAVCGHLGINTKIVPSSSVYNNTHLHGKERVVDICRQTGASHYINPIGGQELYTKEYFKEHHLQLSFIKSLPVTYAQLKEPFVPWLSIIDVLMFNTAGDIVLMLENYELI